MLKHGRKSTVQDKSVGIDLSKLEVGVDRVASRFDSC